MRRLLNHVPGEKLQHSGQQLYKSDVLVMPAGDAFWYLDVIHRQNVFPEFSQDTWLDAILVPQ